MRGVREHVDGLHVGDGIAAGGEVRRVTRQGGRVAGDVNDAARLPVGDGREHFFIATGARRIHDDDIGCDALRGELG